jgi:hypothetical protein
MLCLVALNWARNQLIWNLRSVSTVWLGLRIGAWKLRRIPRTDSARVNFTLNFPRSDPRKPVESKRPPSRVLSRAERARRRLPPESRRERPERRSPGSGAQVRSPPLLPFPASPSSSLCVASPGRPSPGAAAASPGRPSPGSPTSPRRSSNSWASASRRRAAMPTMELMTAIDHLRLDRAPRGRRRRCLRCLRRWRWTAHAVEFVGDMLRRGSVGRGSGVRRRA